MPDDMFSGMTRLEALTRRLVLVLGLGVAAGCDGGAGPLEPAGAGPVEPAGAGPVEPAAAATPATGSRDALDAEVRDDLTRLRALQLVEVGNLRLPDQKTYCYGNPCPDGPAWQSALDSAYQRQVPRLTHLTRIAELAAGDSNVTGADADAAAADIAVLNAMGIVELGHLLISAPASDPRCYNTPCPEDVAQATATNARRAGVVRQWTKVTITEKL
jgi:hypothetical protein